MLERDTNKKRRASDERKRQKNDAREGKDLGIQKEQQFVNQTINAWSG